MPISDRQQRTLVRLYGFVTPDFLDRAKLALRVFGIPYGDLEASKNVSELHRAIERHSGTFAGHDAISLLQFILQMIGVNADKVNKLGSDKKCLEVCRKRSKFAELVCCLCAGLSEDDYSNLKSLACDYIEVDVGAITSRADFFHKCISQEILREDDDEFKQFKEWLNTLGRNDLVSKIDAYISERSQSKQAPETDSNSPDGTVEPPHHIYNVGTPSHLLSHSWFHDSVTRQTAEQRLGSVDSACFLVRPSEQHKEALSLSMKNDQGRIFHYRIIQESGSYAIEGTRILHSTVPDLVSYFKTHSVTDDPKHKLCSACPRDADSATNSDSSSAPTWRKTAELPVAMGHPQVVRVGNVLYAGGGFTNDHSVAKLIMAFDIESETWSVYCTGPTVEFGLTQLNGKLVAVGGIEDGKDNNSPSNKVYMYVFKEKWDDSQIPPFKIARFYAAAFSYESNLVVAGGGVKMTDGIMIRTLSVEVYNGATGQWHSTMDLSLSKQSPGSVSSAFVSKGRAYLIQYNQCMSVDLSSLIEPQLTSQNHSEAQLTNHSSSWEVLICPLKCSAVAIVNEKFVTIGGRRDGKIYPLVHVFNPDTNSWNVVEMGELPEPLYHAAAVHIGNGKIIVVGGEKIQDGTFIQSKATYVGSLIA